MRCSVGSIAAAIISLATHNATHASLDLHVLIKTQAAVRYLQVVKLRDSYRLKNLPSGVGARLLPLITTRKICNHFAIT